MRRCQNCLNRDKECKIGNDSDSCTECIAAGRSCELAFSEAKLRRIQKKRQEKMVALRATRNQFQELLAKQQQLLARQSRLDREVEQLEEQEEVLVRRELQNIEELEKDERNTVSDPNDFLFNVSSESFEVPENFEGFDWSVFPTSHDTAVEAPGSSQGS